MSKVDVDAKGVRDVKYIHEFVRISLSYTEAMGIWSVMSKKEKEQLTDLARALKLHRPKKAGGVVGWFKGDTWDTPPRVKKVDKPKKPKSRDYPAEL